MIKEPNFVDGVNVAECERHCSDNYNNPNMCYSDISESYCSCQPKEYQCDFYVKSLEKQVEELEKDLKEYKRYKRLFEKAREMKERTDKWAQQCLKENENLKDSLNRTVCQSECFRYKEAEKYKSTLKSIEELCKEEQEMCTGECGGYNVPSRILEVIKSL